MGEDIPQQTPEELLAVLPADVRARAERGELLVSQGQSPSKPVLRDAATGALAKGTGRAPKAGDPIKASQAAAMVSYRKSKNYQEALDLLMSVDAGPEVKGSFAWLYERAVWAAQGAPQEVKTVCPHWYPVDEDGEPSDGKAHDEPPCQDPDHTKRVIVQRPDGQLIFKLLELKHGRAKETVEVTGTVSVFAEILETRETPLLVYDVSPSEQSEREAVVDSVLEGVFREISEEESAGGLENGKHPTGNA